MVKFTHFSDGVVVVVLICVRSCGSLCVSVCVCVVKTCFFVVVGVVDDVGVDNDSTCKSGWMDDGDNICRWIWLLDDSFLSCSIERFALLLSVDGRFLFFFVCRMAVGRWWLLELYFMLIYFGIYEIFDDRMHNLISIQIKKKNMSDFSFDKIKTDKIGTTKHWVQKLIWFTNDEYKLKYTECYCNVFDHSPCFFVGNVFDFQINFSLLIFFCRC